MQRNVTINGKQIVVMIVAIGLIAMVISSFLYRLEGPKAHRSAQQGATPGGVKISEEQSADIQKYMEMLQKDPNDTAALAGLGGIFLNNGTWDKAATFWERYLKQKPEDDGAVYHYALALLNLNRFQDSAAQFEILTQLDPKGFQGFYYLGMVNIYYLDNKAKGKEYLEKVLGLNPDHKDVLETVRNELQQMK